MMICIKTEAVELNDIKIGECCRINDNYYQRTDRGSLNAAGAVRMPLIECVNMKTGELIEFEPNRLVRPVNAELHILEGGE